ncbi:MAG: hypothetical protein CRN43_05220 [Candidatus Nephrothrix sp. EaCA]|nr:MAG: hypothetical protein CRN43_05220 [Candidatus Nephrothrix sp. EaCA]
MIKFDARQNLKDALFRFFRAISNIGKQFRNLYTLRVAKGLYLCGVQKKQKVTENSKRTSDPLSRAEQFAP